MTRRPKKSKKPKPEPPDAIVRWTVDAWLGLAGQIGQLRQNHLQTHSNHADWLQQLVQHIGRTINQATGNNTQGHADTVVAVRFRRQTFDWCRRNLILPDEQKPENPAISETAARLRAAIEAGEIDYTEKKGTGPRKSKP